MKALFTTILFCISMQSMAQSILAFGGDDFLYEVKLENCEFREISEHSRSYLDIAAHPNGNLYGIAGEDLYKLDTINSIDEFIISFPFGCNALTCSKEGLFYASSIGGSLLTYDLATEEIILIGEMNSNSSGDLTFYNENLYLAGSNYNSADIVLVDLGEPSNSDVIINNNLSNSYLDNLYGLTKVIYNCNKVNVYTSEAIFDEEMSRIYNLNFDTNLAEEICDVGIIILGTTSFSEHLSALDLEPGISINYIDLIHPECNADNGALEVMVSGNGSLSYSLNNGAFTGYSNFENLEEQQLFLSIVDEVGCTWDTLVELNAPPPLADPTYLESTTCDSTLVNDFEFVLVDQAGCDSIVIVSTSLLLPPEDPLAPSDLVIQENEPPFQISISEVPNATSYIWTVPVGAQILSGEYSNAITVDWGSQIIGGSVCVYALNECGDTKEVCMEVIVEIESALRNLSEKDFSAFPNPTSDLLQIVFPTKVEGTCEIRDLTGKLILKKELRQQRMLNLEAHPNGVYILLLKTEDGIWTERIIKI